MKDFKDLRLFVDGGTDTTKKAESNAISLLINPSQFVYDQMPRPSITMTINGAYTTVIQSLPKGRNTIKNGRLRRET
jgi:hypothetical protein